MKPSPGREEEIFDEAVRLAAPAERSAFLNGACGGNADLRERVEALLLSDSQAGTFLENPPGGVQASLSSPAGRGLTATILTGATTEKPGDRIGRYKLLQQIGEGGCGVVYMAEQEEPVRRRVALKVIKLGMDTKSVMARFEAERQALALMDHPNIAKVFDAGATDAGRPYFVMELVRGVQITEYCDDARLSTPERLALFIQVCHAIQHAHQKGIVHRDIKPSNILVTVNDGVAVPKVIDFGIAKATTGQQLTDKTLFTAFEQFIGTPAYMSPEQAVMSSLDIDTRSDIYSLGVLLYELLTSRTPFAAEELLASGLDEMRRTIRDKEPQCPSACLSTMHEGDRTTTAQRRHSDAPKLFKLLHGDLDWIVMKSIEKDRTRRYATANDLAQDVHRHLCNEVVLARPPSVGYLAVKFVRRHRTGVSVGMALTLTVLLGTGVSVWQAARASRQAALAEARRRDADSSRQVATVARARAELAVKEVTHQLARRYVDNGIQRSVEGNDYGSWVWFAEALHVEQADPAFASIHRLRLGALTRTSPTLLQLLLHSNLVISAEFSADGKKLVTSTLDKTTRIWDVDTGAALTPPLEHSGGVICAHFSADGQSVVTAGFDKTARIWNAVTGAPLTPPMQHDDSVLEAKFSPDGRQLMTISTEQNWQICIRVWDTADGHPVTSPFRPKGSGWPAVISQDSKLIAMAGPNKTARIWDLSTGLPVSAPLQHTGNVEWVAFSPDGSLVATASEDRTARIWDAHTGTPITPPLHHSEGVIYVAFSPDGHRLVTASGESVLRVFPESKEKGEARIWDAASGQALTPPMSHKIGLTSAAFSPDGSRIVTTSCDKTARIWDAKTGEPLTPPLLHGQRVLRASFSPDGQRLATASFDHIARIWDVAVTPNIATKLTASRVEEEHSVSFSPDGERVVGINLEGSAFVWNARSGMPLTPSLHDDVKQAILSPDGRVVATAGVDRTARLWEASTGAELASPMRHAHRILHLAFSPDSKRLVTASTDKTARIWSAATGGPLTPPMQHASNVLWAAFSPNALQVVTASEDKTARVWNASTGAAITPPLPHGGGVQLALFSPDSSRIATASGDGLAQIWDANRGALLTPPMKHGGRFILNRGIESMAFSPDGHRLVIADSTDMTARVWDADMGIPVTPPLRHADAVLFAAFSHNGGCVVTVSRDKTARVWDAATGQPITGPLRHDGPVDYALFTADQRAIRTISHDPKTHGARVWSWDFSPDVRPIKDLLLWAEMYSGQRFDASGALAPVDPEALFHTWQTLQTKH